MLVQCRYFISIHHNIDQILFRDVLNQNIFFRESCLQLKCFCKWQQQSFLVLYWKPLSKKMKFLIKDFFSNCNQICSFLRIWSQLLKKSLIENFIFCAVNDLTQKRKISWKMFIISIKTFNYNYGRHEVTYKRLYWFLWHAKDFMEAATNFLNYFKASHESESKGRLH